MMGGPIDARKSPTAVNNLATNKSFDWFENNVIYRVPANFPGAGRRVYPGFLQYTGFVAMNPDRHATSYYDYFKDLIKGDDASTEAHRKFYDEYNAVLDMDADYYLETIATVFQDFKLVKGTWDVKGLDGKVERVRPQDIKGTALMTVEGELDDISGSGQTRAAQDLCSGVPASERQHLEVPGAGHYGIFSGRRWRDIVYPQVVKFIQGHAPKAKASAPKAVAAAPTVIAAAAPVATKAAKAAVKAPTKTPVKPAIKPAVTNVVKPVAKAAVKVVAAPAAKPAAKAAAPVKAAAKTPAKAVAKAPAKNGKASAQPKGTVKTTWVAPKA
jgi:poly(3-hydroxybutyrate) depolymerase